MNNETTLIKEIRTAYREIRDGLQENPGGAQFARKATKWTVLFGVVFVVLYACQHLGAN